MTVKHQFSPSRSLSSYLSRLSLGRLIFGFLTILSLSLILKNSEVAISYLGKGLLLCARTVIPSLFPFMVISELIVHAGIGHALGRFLSRPMRWIFGVSGAGACAVLLGSICGFPIGAKTAVSLYDRGEISREELESVLTFSNNPSSAFLISAVGLSLYGNRAVGLLLEYAVLISSVIVGVAGKYRFRKNKDTLPPPNREPIGSYVGMFTRSITNAAQSMLIVCAYILFFSSLVGCLSHMLSALSLPDSLRALLFGLFELSSGVEAAAEIGGGSLSLVICAFIVGWSGLSVHLQILSLCDGRGISFKPYFFAKFLQGLLCAALVAILLRLLPNSFLEAHHAVMLSIPLLPTPPLVTALIHVGFWGGVVHLFLSRFRST